MYLYVVRFIEPTIDRKSILSLTISYRASSVERHYLTIDDQDDLPPMISLSNASSPHKLAINVVCKALSGLFFESNNGPGVMLFVPLKERELVPEFSAFMVSQRRCVSIRMWSGAEGILELGHMSWKQGNNLLVFPTTFVCIFFPRYDG